MTMDFVAGCVCGALIIPAIVRLVLTGRLDGWYLAPKRMPPVGATVLAWRPERGLAAVTYNGPEGGGEIPESAQLFWRPFPALPWGAPRRRGG